MSGVCLWRDPLLLNLISSLGLTFIEFRALFFVSSQYVNKIDCFPVMILRISKKSLNVSLTFFLVWQQQHLVQIFGNKINLSPQWYRLGVLRLCSGVFDSLFIVALIVLWVVYVWSLFCCTLVFGPCFIVYHLVSFQDLQSTRRNRESCLLYFNCLLIFSWLLVFCVSNSRCRGLVCSVCLWHLLVIFNYLACNFAQYNFKSPRCHNHKQGSAVS